MTGTPTPRWRAFGHPLAAQLGESVRQIVEAGTGVEPHCDCDVDLDALRDQAVLGQ
jgi:hypothetical protein